MSAGVNARIGEFIEPFELGPWKFVARKSHILNSEDAAALSGKLSLPQLPEMTFGHNKLIVDHDSGFSIEFETAGALRQVDNQRDLMKVAMAKEWKESRTDNEFIIETIKPFDWTFTTDYKGTVNDPNELVKVVETEERIDIEKLKAKEKILFFEEMTLFEDELADNGCALLTVKIRVMPSCFFILMRFFLRVDGVLLRINDTRLYHEFGTNRLIREYMEKERTYKEMKPLHIPPAALTDANFVDGILATKNCSLDMISFENSNNSKQTLHTAVADLQTPATATTSTDIASSISHET